MRILKYVLSLALCIALLFTASSCVVIKSDAEQMQDSFMDFVHKVESADREGLLSLFSDEALEAQDTELAVDELIGYVKGILLSSFPCFTDVSLSEDATVKEYRYCYDFTTSGDSYRVYMYEVISDKGSPEREGLCSLYIIRRAEDSSADGYRGDGKDTPGIHIGLVPVEVAP